MYVMQSYTFGGDMSTLNDKLKMATLDKPRTPNKDEKGRIDSTDQQIL